jgi:hypothetical protein
MFCCSSFSCVHPVWIAARVNGAFANQKAVDGVQHRVVGAEMLVPLDAHCGRYVDGVDPTNGGGHEVDHVERGVRSALGERRRPGGDRPVRHRL